MHLQKLKIIKKFIEIYLKNSRALVDRRSFAAFSALVNAVRWKFTAASSPFSNAFAELAAPAFLAISVVEAADCAVRNFLVVVRFKVVDFAFFSAEVVDAIAVWPSHWIDAALAVVLAVISALVHFAVEATKALRTNALELFVRASFSASSAVHAVESSAVFALCTAVVWFASASF